MPVVFGLEFDDANADKITAHGLSERLVSQVLDNPHIIVRNRRRRRGLYLLIGVDHGGGCIAIPIEPTRQPGIWRPVTAWQCKDSERALLLERGRRL